MVLSDSVAEVSVVDSVAIDEGDTNPEQLAEQHLLYSQHVLAQMAQVKIVVDESGLTLISPDNNIWEPDDMASDFAQMPEAFAQSYLQLRLRKFLYRAFCRTRSAHDFGDSELASETLASETLANPEIALETSETDASNPQVPTFINDRVGGGLHVGLLKQFELSNQGKGYFDPGWQVIRKELDGAIAVQKHGIIVHVEPRHLSAEKQAAPHSIQPGDLLAIRLPGYRFEPDVYIAIGDQGPVTDIDQAQEIYFAATADAMPLIMKMLTTWLNGNLLSDALHHHDSHHHDSHRSNRAIPYTLQMPYEPEGYRGPEAIVLRIKKKDFDQVLPLLQQIWETCSSEIHFSKICSQLEIETSSISEISEGEAALLRPEVPLFAYPLWPGISMADVIESSATEWFGSSIEQSRIHWIAEALTQNWYEQSAEDPTLEISPESNLLAIQTQFADIQLSWEQPFSRSLTI